MESILKMPAGVQECSQMPQQMPLNLRAEAAEGHRRQHTLSGTCQCFILGEVAVMCRCRGSAGRMLPGLQGQFGITPLDLAKTVHGPPSYPSHGTQHCSLVPESSSLPSRDVWLNYGNDRICHVALTILA